jgi:hypothetical protein
MGFHRLAERMEAWVALPDCGDAWLAVARAGSEAPALGQVPHELAARGRSLRRGAVRPPGSHGVPLPGCTHAGAGHRGVGATRPGAPVEAPGPRAVARPGGQPPLRRRPAARLALTAGPAPPAQACAGPPTPRPRHHRPGPRRSRSGPAREHPPGPRLRAASWAALRRLDRHDLAGWPPRQRDGQPAGGPPPRPGRPHVTRRVRCGETPRALRADAACRPCPRPTRQRLQTPRVHIPCPIRRVPAARRRTPRLGLACQLLPV